MFTLFSLFKCSRNDKRTVHLCANQNNPGSGRSSKSVCKIEYERVKFGNLYTSVFYRKETNDTKDC